ncbi:integrase [Vibrio cholerae]|uniref:tyrosine-type recombinase/integrase n=1 Tax=Vibrio cholerae TaxID=666 RepID=UPI0011D7744E|nr:site-specific integrase [Vibrio cholerae]TXX90538.1 DUF4102 domain-containing protein [Vibrio cholerae]GHW45624.1 integrase [Vibrio cholerae]
MLTTKELQALKPQKSPYYKWDKTGERGKTGKGRLGVQVSRAGTVTFKFRYFVNKKANFINIGIFPSISLADARKVAERYSAMVEQGIAPKEELARLEAIEVAKDLAESQQASIKQLFEAQRDFKKLNGKRNYQEDFDDLEKYTYPYIPPETKAKDVTAKHIIPILAEMIDRGAASLSNHVRKNLHAAFSFGLKHENNPANPTTINGFGLSINPVSQIPVQTSAEKVGDHFLSFEELFTLLGDMSFRYDDLKMDSQTRDIIKLCFYLGGQRPYEICNLRWKDIDEKEMIITIPDFVSKNGKPLLIALTSSSLALLKKYKPQNKLDYLFYKKTNTKQPKPTNTLAQAIARYRNKTNIDYFVARDFRRTFKTLGGALGISKEYRDRVQGHALNDVSSKHYDRYDYLVEKRAVMKNWCEYLDKGLLNEFIRRKITPEDVVNSNGLIVPPTVLSKTEKVEEVQDNSVYRHSAMMNDIGRFSSETENSFIIDKARFLNLLTEALKNQQDQDSTDQIDIINLANKIGLILASGCSAPETLSEQFMYSLKIGLESSKLTS